MRRCWDQWIREKSFIGTPSSGRFERLVVEKTATTIATPITVLPLIPFYRRHHLEWYHARGNWTVAEWNKVVFSDESTFNLSSHDNCAATWRPHGELFNPAFVLHRHSTPTAGVVVWSVIAYDTRSILLLIHGTMVAQRYVYEILQTHVLPLMQRFPGAIFQQHNAQPHTARLSENCIRTVTTVP
ncbi:transposable element Tcb2 transposase [Trichonephila clavipes]|nr:transposable element Tcb2 transposase [Trichonephila clavipes]